METENNVTPSNRNSDFPQWAAVAGVVFGGLTFLFFMMLLLMSIFDKSLPQTATTKFLVITFLALGVALAFAFIGGDAAAKGRIPVPFFNSNPVEFSVAGGIAVFIIVLLIGNAVYKVEPQNQNGTTGVDYAYLIVNTSGVPIGTMVRVLDENGDVIFSTTTGPDTTLRIRIDKQYIGSEITVSISAVGFITDSKSIRLSEESTIEFAW